MWEFLQEESSCHLNVLINMLKCLFCRDILLNNDSIRCAYLRPQNNPSDITLEQYPNFELRRRCSFVRLSRAVWSLNGIPLRSYQNCSYKFGNKMAGNRIFEVLVFNISRTPCPGPALDHPSPPPPPLNNTPRSMIVETRKIIVKIIIHLNLKNMHKIYIVNNNMYSSYG